MVVFGLSHQPSQALDDISAAWANGVLDEDSHRDHTFDT